MVKQHISIVVGLDQILGDCAGPLLRIRNFAKKLSLSVAAAGQMGVWEPGTRAHLGLYVHQEVPSHL